MTDIIDTVQLQETDDAIIQLFDITLPDAEEPIYLFNGMDDGTDNLYFPEKTIDSDTNTYLLKEYIAFPLNITGLETKSSGSPSRPTLTMANVPVLTRNIGNNEDGDSDEESILDILENAGISNNEDFLGTTIVVRSTFLSKTYSSTASNPATGPVEFPSQKYVLDRVSAETNITVEFELASPMDIEGVMIPSRNVIGRYCPWRYQGHNLAEEGGCTWPLDSNGRFFDENDNIITKTASSIPTYDDSVSNVTRSLGYRTKTVDTSNNNYTQIWEAIRAVPAESSAGQYDPRKNRAYWKRLDVCSKTLNGCKIRFQGNNSSLSLNTSFPLPFGGFPGSKQFR